MYYQYNVILLIQLIDIVFIPMCRYIIFLREYLMNDSRSCLIHLITVANKQLDN